MTLSGGAGQGETTKARIVRYCGHKFLSTGTTMFIRSILAALVVFAATASASRQVFAGPQALPANWQLSSASLDRTRVVRVSIALVPKDASRLESEILAVSTPGSARFRKYLKPSQVTEIVGRSDAEIQKLREWLATENLQIDSVHPHRDWVTVSGTVDRIESLFQCKLGEYSNDVLGKRKVGKSDVLPPLVSLC
ncbi:hypothetical protein EON64_02260 [archaeon]|nr:MAG: hypothetical protein EON64_02260 [archaeon]